MGIRPMNDKILVIRIEEEEKTSGGIIIPDTAKEKPHEGKVVAVGPGKTNKKGQRVPLEVKKGDQVLFAVYAGTEITISGVEHLIMQEDDILNYCTIPRISCRRMISSGLCNNCSGGFSYVRKRN